MLSKSKVSICMNIFEDLCGMITLGSLEIEPEILIKCTKIALETTKHITRIVRKSWDNKSTIPLIDINGMDTLKNIQRQNKK